MVAPRVLHTVMSEGCCYLVFTLFCQRLMRCFGGVIPGVCCCCSCSDEGEPRSTASASPAGVLTELISNISLPFGVGVRSLYSKKLLILKWESALELN